jgi:hypothetical protein
LLVGLILALAFLWVAGRSNLTASLVSEALWDGFKAVPWAIFHLATSHSRAYLVQACYLAGILVFGWMAWVVLRRLIRNA